MNDEKLLELYLSIWNNRKSTNCHQKSEELLKAAVLSELLDEQTHPRLRVSKETKFFFAVQRISNSSLDLSEKMGLINYFIKQMEGLRG
ncbi:hypothetical protein M3685_04760 [Heyndrickxia oleronia]|uniref:hypothetical protein n=1 Tax=Heyndrickxia oleronia TaxID=38875 RepID=UPI00203CDEE5|nr:hypothetical protein [Heyndrickxia oleronia]MCM3453244.1 hypothetical protein [Heyndrickxia oleronia]